MVKAEMEQNGWRKTVSSPGIRPRNAVTANRPLLRPFLYTASSVEEELLDLDQACNQSQHEIDYLDTAKSKEERDKKESDGEGEEKIIQTLCGQEKIIKMSITDTKKICDNAIASCERRKA